MNKPKAIGTACETAIVRWVRPRGFPGADRAPLKGNADEGDVWLCPGALIESKGGHRAETASDALIAEWLVETEVERVNHGADVAALVTKRKGKGPANAGSWWAYLPGRTYTRLALDASGGTGEYPTTADDLPAVRITLADLVTLLRRAGYGDPL